MGAGEVQIFRGSLLIEGGQQMISIIIDCYINGDLGLEGHVSNVCFFVMSQNLQNKEGSMFLAKNVVLRYSPLYVFKVTVSIYTFF